MLTPLVLRSKASKEAKNLDGRTPSEVADVNQHHEIVKVLE